MLIFFDNRCQEPPISAQLFGLCDDQNGLKAYTNVLDPNTWVATIEPETKKHFFDTYRVRLNIQGTIKL